MKLRHLLETAARGGITLRRFVRQVAWFIGWCALFAMWAVVLWELKTKWYITSTKPFAYAFSGAFMIATVTALTIVLSTAYSPAFKRSFESWWCQYVNWYVAASIGTFLASLTWTVTSWPPSGVTGWVSWTAALIACIAVVGFWIYLLFSMRTDDQVC